jgi:hypothetical protein
VREGHQTSSGTENPRVSNLPAAGRLPAHRAAAARRRGRRQAAGDFAGLGAASAAGVCQVPQRARLVEAGDDGDEDGTSVRAASRASAGTEKMAVSMAENRGLIEAKRRLSGLALCPW